MRSTLPLIINVFLISVIGCNSKQQTADSSASRDTFNKAHIKKLADSYYQGKSIFKEHCNSCHLEPESRTKDQYLFDNLLERLPPPPEDYFVKYIKDSKSLKASSDKYARNLDEVWDSKYEHYFKDSLSEQDFSNLITYIKVAAKQRYQPNN